MTEAEFKRIANYIKTKYGIDMFAKKAIVEGRLSNMLIREGYASYTDYMNAVEADASGEMDKELVNLVTTNHTYFMREFEHLDFLRLEILPWLRQKEEKSRDLRIWCGAASTGEEPYMIAMTIMDFFGFELKDWDTTVLATDLSVEALSTAVRGRYSAAAIEGMSEHWKKRFFKNIPGTDEYQATEELKAQVLFRQFNLMEDFPFRRKMHVVFLRNVMIYFDQPTKNALVQKIYDFLEPGGYLIVGKTETVDTGEIPFKMVKPSIFRKELA